MILLSSHAIKITLNYNRPNLRIPYKNTAFEKMRTVYKTIYPLDRQVDDGLIDGTLLFVLWKIRKSAKLLWPNCFLRTI